MDLGYSEEDSNTVIKEIGANEAEYLFVNRDFTQSKREIVNKSLQDALHTNVKHLDLLRVVYPVRFAILHPENPGLYLFQAGKYHYKNGEWQFKKRKYPFPAEKKLFGENIEDGVYRGLTQEIHLKKSDIDKVFSIPTPESLNKEDIRASETKSFVTHYKQRDFVVLLTNIGCIQNSTLPDSLVSHFKTIDLPTYENEFFIEDRDHPGEEVNLFHWKELPEEWAKLINEEL